MLGILDLRQETRPWKSRQFGVLKTLRRNMASGRETCLIQERTARNDMFSNDSWNMSLLSNRTKP